MHIIKSVAVDLLHDMGSCPSARFEDVGIGDILGMEIRGEKVPQAVEGVMWLNTQCLLTLNESFGDVVGRQVRDISLLPYTIGYGSREQDSAIG